MTALISPPGNNAVDVQDDDGKNTQIGQGWRIFFTAVYNILSALTRSGTTAQRPTLFLWEGTPYTDTTLGRPIWFIGGIWVFSDGTPA